MQALELLREQALSCTACRLADTRKNVVFGTGNPDARVLFVGEAPGEQEDKSGEPFVGRAGILLDKMLLAAGFSRKENIYITNMVKCRPPGNRDPAPGETAACIGFLREQARLIAPDFIVCLGRIAAQALIDPGFKVTARHGEFITRAGVRLMATFHPSALLRNPNSKPAAFDDLCRLRDLYSRLA